MDLGIAGKTAIVCGGSAGLGRGAATALAADGVIVYLAARDEGRLNAAAREIAEETSGNVIPSSPTSPPRRDATPCSRPARSPTS